MLGDEFHGRRNILFICWKSNDVLIWMSDSWYAYGDDHTYCLFDVDLVPAVDECFVLGLINLTFDDDLS